MQTERLTGRNLPVFDATDNHSTRWNLAPAALVEEALAAGEGQLAANGALVVRTGQFTGRSPRDKYIVRDETTQSAVHWGAVNQPMDSEVFDRLFSRLARFLRDKKLYVKDCFGGASPLYRIPVRVITQRAWHSLFAHQLFLRPEVSELTQFEPEFTLVFAPDFNIDPATDGTRSETAIVINFSRRLVVIAGTMYAGEMKKSVFTLLNHLLPEKGVLPMHCSANAGNDAKVALFFGLSGTGKTTLSADPERHLIGDDEHGWSDRGIFNFEGGCYAKTIRLSREREPQIWNAIRFGTVLENVALDETTRELDYNSEVYTENTRAAYPVHHIDNAVIPGIAGQPNMVVFLTADAFGVLPPISKLTPEQAMYHFLSGYTSKLAGTERGLGKEPVPNFSACFGEPFLTRHPEVYAKMLGEKMRQHGVTCWLVNTGWVGGPYGVGQRMHLPYTRAMVDHAVDGHLNFVDTRQHPIFGVAVPVSCPDIPSQLLDARGQWSDPAAYDRAAADLAARFRANFEAKFASVDPAIAAAGPRVAL
jgi:phosphoenolpyruvate carboxykinase (ATP)